MLIHREKSPLYYIYTDASTDPILIPATPRLPSLHLPKRHFLQRSEWGVRGGTGGN